MVFVVFLIFLIWIIFKYEPHIDILEIGDNEYLVLWYNYEGDSTHREYYILF